MAGIDGDRARVVGRGVTRRAMLFALGVTAVVPVLAACGGEAPPQGAASRSAATSAPSTTSSAATSSSAATTSSAASSSAASSAPSSATSSAAATKPAATRFGPGASLKVLVGSHFVPAFDEWRKKFIAEWGAKNNVKANFDFIPGLSVPAALAAEVAAGSGHDIVQIPTITPHLFQKSLVDISDIMEPMGKKYGGWLDIGLEVGKVGDRWLADPDYWIVNTLVWRKDLFDQEGLKAPQTWDDLYNAAKVLKPKRHQTGIAVSHCNDSSVYLRSFLACHGATLNDKDGNITVDTKEMRFGLKKFYELWRDGMTDEVFSWDDASDNRLIDSGVACWVQDALSAYRSASPRLQNVMNCGLGVKGPAMHVTYIGSQPLAIWNFSKNIEVAKQFMVDLMDAWPEAVVASKGYNMPYLKDHAKKPMPVLGEDPKLQALQDAGTIAHNIGWPGPLDTRAGAVYGNYILPDMVGKVLKGNATDDVLDSSIKWMEEQMQAVHRQFPK